MGSNDYAAYATTTNPPTPEQYAQLLIDQYSLQLRDLYNLGTRKVALFGLGTIGCVPAALGGGIFGPLCLTSTNNTSGVFNAKLKDLVDVLNKELRGAKLIYVDVFGITVSDPSISGLKNTYTPCCQVSGAGMCVLQGAACDSRSDYEYFDGFHPTEATAIIVAGRAFAAHSPSDAYPYDIQRLAQAI